MASKTKKSDKKDASEFDRNVRDMFNIIDTNNDKSISVDELAQYLKTLEIDMTYNELKEAVNKLDSNKNGKLEFTEFRKFIRQQSKQHSKALEREKQVREAFRMFDRDGNGVIDRMELKKALKTLLGEQQITNEQVSAMMKEADTNQDGKIDYDAKYLFIGFMDPQLMNRAEIHAAMVAKGIPRLKSRD